MFQVAQKEKMHLSFFQKHFLSWPQMGVRVLDHYVHFRTLLPQTINNSQKLFFNYDEVSNEIFSKIRHAGALKLRFFFNHGEELKQILPKNPSIWCVSELSD